MIHLERLADNLPKHLADDPMLAPYQPQLKRRMEAFHKTCDRLTGGTGDLVDFACGHHYYGLHREKERWVFREWAPNAQKIVFYGDATNWQLLPQWELTRLNEKGDWELSIPLDALHHGMHYKLRMFWNDQNADRLPSYADFVVQNPETNIFTAQVWSPEEPYLFCHQSPTGDFHPVIYEAHPGMAQEEEKVGSFEEFRLKILPRIAGGHYNTIQLMAVMSHPYYGSFGYHVANFFSISSRFGTPEELKHLVDDAHALGLRVIIDLVHSHAVRNEIEGLGRFDGSRTQYFHEGARGEHPGWDSLCFNYSKDQVLHFLLSNCRYYLEKYRIDGFRFDGVTSMLYFNHGLNRVFGSYDDYFASGVDEESITYLALANALIHEFKPGAITVAEDVSGMPGLGAPQSEGGIGFDYRLAMGVTDLWFKFFDIPDHDWDMARLYYELTNRRRDEKTISYVESHDQAIVGGQTAIFRLIGSDMYNAMHTSSVNYRVDRGMALHKMARALTMATAGNGYLNFIGNEFGHPEWIDFPREGNQWSYRHARRQWSLCDREDLRFHFLNRFDRAMLLLVEKYRLYDYAPKVLLLDNQAKLIQFERGNLWFFFNFHPENSYNNHPVRLLPGEYECVLASDGIQFGGFGRVAPDQHYFTRCVRNGESNELVDIATLYLPARSALILKRKEPSSC